MIRSGEEEEDERISAENRREEMERGMVLLIPAPGCRGREGGGGICLSAAPQPVAPPSG